MAKNKFTMTSEEQWHTMQSLMMNVANQLKDNFEQIQQYMDEAKDTDLSQMTPKTHDTMQKLYIILEEDLKLIRDIVTIRNIENTADREFDHSYRAFVLLCDGLFTHTETVVNFILDNNIPIDEFHEKNKHRQYHLRELVTLMVSTGVNKTAERRDKENAN